MTAWHAFLNDQIGDCGVAACCNAINLWYGDNTVDDFDAKEADDRFSAADYTSKVLWGWWRRGIGGNYLGGFARIRPEQIPDAVTKFGCAYVSCSAFRGIQINHAVLAIPGDKVVSWGSEYPISDCVIEDAFALAPKFHPIFVWWALRNNPRWLIFLAPLWWPQ